MGTALILAVVVLVLSTPAHGGLIAVGFCAPVAGWWLAGRRRRRREARSTSQAIQRICAEIADDLALGRVPEDAIVDAARRWPRLRPAAVAAEFHHDVARALRDVAALPGAAGLRDVSAAWHVSEQSGSGLTDVLREVANLLAARERRARLVDAELAAARATAMVVSGLPVLVLGMGSGLGADPWSFFFSGWGSVLMALAGALLFAGWAWLDGLTGRASR